MGAIPSPYLLLCDNLQIFKPVEGDNVQTCIMGASNDVSGQESQVKILPVKEGK